MRATSLIVLAFVLSGCLETNSLILLGSAVHFARRYAHLPRAGGPARLQVFRPPRLLPIGLRMGEEEVSSSYEEGSSREEHEVCSPTVKREFQSEA
jgi:hypothetical protein